MDGNQLMLGFAATAEGDARAASSEVVSSRWCTPEEAISSLREGSIAQQTFEIVLFSRGSAVVEHTGISTATDGLADVFIDDFGIVREAKTFDAVLIDGEVSDGHPRQFASHGIRFRRGNVTGTGAIITIIK